MCMKGMYIVREAGSPTKNLLISLAGPLTNVALLLAVLACVNDLCARESLLRRFAISRLSEARTATAPGLASSRCKRKLHPPLSYIK